MENGWFIWNLKNSFIVYLILFSIFACNQKQAEKTRKVIHTQDLHSGDMVLRLGNGFFSNYFKQYASSEKKFSHVGILFIDHNQVFVYHTEASELTGIGKVKKELLSNFLTDIEVYEFYRLQYPDSILNAILNKAQNYHALEIPFDTSFNSFDESELYCTELVANSINYACRDSVIKPTLVLNHHKIYALDDLYKHPNVNKINIQK
jgi:hypothetical protein